MKILHVIPAVAQRYGGPSRAVFDMCRALEKRGCETLICTTDADGRGTLPVTLKHVGRYQGINTIFFRRQFSEAYKYSHSLALWLEDNVKNFDVVHVHAVFSHSSLAASKACRRHNIPYVIRPLGSLSHLGMNTKSFRKKILWGLGVRRMLNGASIIHYTSAEERHQAEAQLGHQRGAVVPLGVGQEELEAYLSEVSAPAPEPAEAGGSGGNPDPYVLILSRLHPIKGLENFLRAFVTVRNEAPFQHWKLKLAGDGEPEYVSSLQKLVEGYGACDCVSFLGWVSGGEKLALLKQAAVLALPSLHENFGLSLVEALACGIPVLISPQVNLAPDIEAAKAGWVTDLRPEALDGALREVLQQEDEREKRGAAGRNLVLRRFTWSAVSAELLYLYETVADGRTLCPALNCN